MSLFLTIPSGLILTNTLSTWMKDRKALIIILILCLTCNILLVTICDKDMIMYIICSGCLIVLTVLFENTASLTFNKIIPSNYEICKISASKLINYVTVSGRIIGSFILFPLSTYDYDMINKLVYGTTSGLFVLILLIIIIFYSNLRVKAIARILRNRNKIKSKATEF